MYYSSVTSYESTPLKPYCSWDIVKDILGLVHSLVWEIPGSQISTDILRSLISI